MVSRVAKSLSQSTLPFLLFFAPIALGSNFEPIANMPYSFSVFDFDGNVSNHCLDGTQTWKSNSNVILYSCHGNPLQYGNQVWKFEDVDGTYFKIRSWQTDSKCLVVDAEGTWPGNGVNIRIEGPKDNGHNACETAGAEWLPVTVSTNPVRVKLLNRGTSKYLGRSFNCAELYNGINVVQTNDALCSMHLFPELLD